VQTIRHNYAEAKYLSRRNLVTSSLMESALNVMIVSCVCLGEQACVQRPVISSISAQAVTLAVDKPLRGSMLSAEVRWRIDKDEVSSIFTRMRCNLLGETHCPTCKGHFSA